MANGVSNFAKKEDYAYTGNNDLLAMWSKI